MAKKSAKTTTVTVERSIERVGGEPISSEHSSEVIAVHQFVTPPAEVGAMLGLTINIGNYESARIEISCKVPCYKEEMEDAYDYAFKFAESKLQQEIAEVRRSQQKKA